MGRGLRVALAVAFVIGEVTLVALTFSADDDPWATILALALPFVRSRDREMVGNASGADTRPHLRNRPQQHRRSRRRRVALAASITFNAICLVLGVALGRLIGLGPDTAEASA